MADEKNIVITAEQETALIELALVKGTSVTGVLTDFINIAKAQKARREDTETILQRLAKIEFAKAVPSAVEAQSIQAALDTIDGITLPSGTNIQVYAAAGLKRIAPLLKTQPSTAR